MLSRHLPEDVQGPDRVPCAAASCGRGVRPADSASVAVDRLCPSDVARPAHARGAVRVYGGHDDFRDAGSRLCRLSSQRAPPSTGDERHLDRNDADNRDSHRDFAKASVEQVPPGRSRRSSLLDLARLGGRFPVIDALLDRIDVVVRCSPFHSQHLGVLCQRIATAHSAE